MSAVVQLEAVLGDEFGVNEIVESLAETRAAAQRRRYRGAPPPMPSRAMIGEVVHTLSAVLYPRHFGPRDLRPKQVDAFVKRSLLESLGDLRRQIALELALAREWKVAGRTPDPAQAAALTQAFAESLPRIRTLLDSDLKAAFDGDPSAKSVDEIIFCFPGFAAILRHRLAHRLYQLGATLVARIVAEIAHSETGIDIHPGAAIGEGFFIDHGTGVVIGETAVIGRNVRLYQAVTLGAKRFESDANGVLVKNVARHPIVEDDVVIYAGATILGRITIGRGSSIGGNVWLTSSVPPGSSITQAKARSESWDGGGGI